MYTLKIISNWVTHGDVSIPRNTDYGTYETLTEAWDVAGKMLGQVWIDVAPGGFDIRDSGNVLRGRILVVSRNPFV